MRTPGTRETLFAELDVPMRVLVVEDETRLAGQLAEALAAAGYAVDVAGDGGRAGELAAAEHYDAVVLDLGLPRVDGLTLLRRWRAEGLLFPILVVTARDSWHEKVQGIDGGADDYVGKPFRMEEVVARVRALIRRAAGHASPALSCGPILLDTRTSTVTRAGVPVRLTAHEYRVLSYLMHHRGRIVSQGELTDHVYGLPLEPGSNTVEVFVARLRRKLGADCIETLRGLGYRMAAR